MANQAKHICLYILVLFVLNFSAAAQDSCLFDGPYVSYSADSAILKYVTAGMPVTHSCKLEDLQKKEINVDFPGNLGVQFRFQLKKSLKIEACKYPLPPKMFAVSDIEGEFEGFRNLLIANGIMNAKSEWIFGKGHLVIVGDLFDRGRQVTQQLWLLYNLEEKAKLAGGYVHLILGNHDIMNLSGDFRYVDQKYMLSAKRLGTDYGKLYDENTELGRWLRTKNIMEKIGDHLFVHGGISPEILKLRLGIQQINDMARPCYATPKKELSVIMQTIFGKDGPFWYRGYFMGSRATTADIDLTLVRFGVKQIVVGHTIVDKNITAYYQGKVIGIDVDQHSGKHFGVLYKAGKWQIGDDKGKVSELVYRPENDIIKPEQIL